MSPSLTRQDFCRSVTHRMVVRSKGRITALHLVRKDRPPPMFRLLAVNSSIRGQGKQYTRQGCPRAPQRCLPSWHFSRVVSSQSRGALGRKRMAHAVGISGKECILVWQRRISTPSSQILCNVTKLESFTTFACLTTAVSIGVNRTHFNEPARDASSAFRQYVLSWLYWVIVAGQDLRNTSTTLWTRLIATLVVVWQVRAA